MQFCELDFSTAFKHMMTRKSVFLRSPLLKNHLFAKSTLSIHFQVLYFDRDCLIFCHYEGLKELLKQRYKFKLMTYSKQMVKNQ